MASIHDEPRIYSATAIQVVFGKDLGFHATRHLAGVGYQETSYGRGWKGAGSGSFNMGAIQAGPGWRGETFEYVDTHPNPDGTSTPYRVAFRKYPNAELGWEDLARVMFGGQRHPVLVAAKNGDTMTVSQRMRETGYYEGFGATQRDRIWNHFVALRKGIYVADGAQGIEIPGGSPVGIPSTVRRGDRGDAVKTLQRELQIAADGIFGPVTEREVKEYQVMSGLADDGIVGPATWQALFTDGYVPEEP